MTDSSYLLAMFPLSSYTKSMPARQPSINLLKQDLTTNSPWNRMLHWISSYGRYIMITTELIVLVAFASRFSLDRKLTDLKENIMEKEEILKANVTLEKNIRQTQEKIADVKLLMNQQSTPVEIVTLIQTLMPEGTNLEVLTVQRDSVSAQMMADTARSLSQFAANVSLSKKLTNIEIGKIGKKPNGIQFTMTANVRTTQPSIQK